MREKERARWREGERESETGREGGRERERGRKGGRERKRGSLKKRKLPKSHPHAHTCAWGQLHVPLYTHPPSLHTKTGGNASWIAQFCLADVRATHAHTHTHTHTHTQKTHITTESWAAKHWTYLCDSPTLGKKVTYSRGDNRTHTRSHARTHDRTRLRKTR